MPLQRFFLELVQLAWQEGYLTLDNAEYTGLSHPMLEPIRLAIVNRFSALEWITSKQIMYHYHTERRQYDDILMALSLSSAVFNQDEGRLELANEDWERFCRNRPESHLRNNRLPQFDLYAKAFPRANRK